MKASAAPTLNNLSHQFQLLPSGRRYNLPKCMSNGAGCWLVPPAVHFLNNPGGFLSFRRTFGLGAQLAAASLANNPLGRGRRNKQKKKKKQTSW